MKKLLLLLGLAVLPLQAQNVTVVKAPATATNANQLLTGNIVVGNSTSITATGNGTIVATGGAATTMPWAGLTNIPSPTLFWQGDASGNVTFLATGNFTGNLTLASVTSAATVGNFTVTPVITFDAKGRITSVTTAPLVSDASLTNSTGNTTITPASVMDTENITLSGSAGSRGIVVSTATATPGARCDLVFAIPATANIAVTVYSGSTSGPSLQTFTTTGASVITSARLTLEFSGTAWQSLYYQGPIP